MQDQNQKRISSPIFPNDKTLSPSLQCHDLTVSLHSSHSFLALTASFLSLRVPLPTILHDGDTPVTSWPLSDHIEVKLLLLLLLLPVDHPVLSTIDDSPPPLLDPLVAQFVENPRDDGVDISIINCELDDERTSTCCDDGVVGKRGGEQECSSLAENGRDDGVGNNMKDCESNDERNLTCSDDEVTRAFDNSSRFAHPENEKVSMNSICKVVQNEVINLCKSV
ncbi:hypothetical protein Fmac_015714 [Flemingia macrophylla]|uniref:Uncharacterized protein n=1 Tax=Flemingia macrophylla TaxID=520843 RepID=A0ABD1MFH6_9FABA